MNKKLPQLVASISELAGTQISETDVLSIDEIDSHQINVNSTDFDFNYLNLSFPEYKTSELFQTLSCLSEEISQVNYFSLSHTSDIIVFNIHTGFIPENAEKIIKLSGDNFRIFDSNYINGLWIYGLRVFGKEWIKKVKIV